MSFQSSVARMLFSTSGSIALVTCDAEHQHCAAFKVLLLQCNTLPFAMPVSTKAIAKCRRSAYHGVRIWLGSQRIDVTLCAGYKKYKLSRAGSWEGILGMHAG